MKRQRERNRREVHIKCFLVLTAGIIIGTVSLISGIDRAMADGDTYINPEYIRYCR